MGFYGKARGHVEEQEIAWAKIKDVKCPLPPIIVEWVICKDGFQHPTFWVDGKEMELSKHRG